MPAVANCGPCSQFSCEAHRKFKITCNQCREQRYSNCCSFKCSIEIILTQNGDKDAKDYLSNFVNDFLNLSELTVSFFSIEISKKTVEKKEQINYVKCYRKSEKNRLQVVDQVLQNTDKLQYRFKGRKHHFYQNK